uniref:Uncharacterized protein n=1 Tax=Heliothis virescens TaxID=7102 RepID=A0A2A4JH90_HELVI
MPVTLVDRLPLPNLKVYTAGSVSVLSIAVYYALSVTSDPNWRVNATLGRQDAMEPGEGEPRLLPAPMQNNATRNVSEQFVDVMTFMMQEPLCMWVSTAAPPPHSRKDSSLYQPYFGKTTSHNSIIYA